MPLAADIASTSFRVFSVDPEGKNSVDTREKKIQLIQNYFLSVDPNYFSQLIRKQFSQLIREKILSSSETNVAAAFNDCKDVL